MANKLLHKGNLIELHHERVDFPQGGHTYFDIVKHPGGAVIAAINEKNEICLLEQWRHAISKTIWEKRELEEEAGVVASEWRDLGYISSSPGFSNELLYLFEARNISDGTLKLDDAEQLQAHWIAIDKAYDMALNGDIIDAKTLAVLLKLKF